ncbi:hypothetical protein K5X82_18775 [Halosquirtibacter xylanolyticus]|uniref:hypothetical protein n=1 Tax=Halosquirtibacter xylanolyticus TaxID=3374599 RepID=UPI003749A008|nr:hypothetical protein K5X82_18775 [Prolixibacteraceae bacterium]
MKTIFKNYRSSVRRSILLFLISLTGTTLVAKETFWDRLEIGAGLGPTKFTGTVNMSSGDFLGFYRTDGNSIGLAFTPEFRLHLNDYFALDMHMSIATLSGNVTYNGDPTGTSVTVTPGTQRAYKTTMYNFIPMVNFNVIEMVNPGAGQDFALMVRGGIGMSYCGIQTLPFTPEDKLYDFGESSHWVLTGAGGVVLKKSLDSHWSLFGAFTFLLSATSKVDAYYLDSKPVNEGIPMSEGSMLPFAGDSHAYMSFGVSYRLGGVSSVGGRRYKSKKMNARSLNRRRKKYRSPWVK